MKKKLFLFLLFLGIISLFSILPLFNKGFFQSDDGTWMIIRFSAFHQALRDGEFPVRFLGRLNYGYGYPVSNFLYPGFMYIAEPIHLMGFGFVDSIKIILGISVIGSAFFAFLWLNKIFDEISALTGSVFYVYTPYHLYDLYKRGSVGEVLAMMFIPFILWMIKRGSLFWVSVGIFLLIISHNTLAFLFLPVLFIYSLLTKPMSIKSTLISFILGLFMSSFFIIPAIYELSYVNFSSIEVADFRKYFSTPDLIGTSSFIILFLSIVIFVLRREIKKEKNFSFIFFTIITIFAIFFSSSLSVVFWKFLPSSFIQFPFRILSYAVLSISFLASFLIFNSYRKIKYFLLSVVSVILLFSAIPFIRPSESFDKGDYFYSTNEATTTVKDEYMPKWVKQKPESASEKKVQVLGRAGYVNKLNYNSKEITFHTVFQESGKLRINTIYYPGWKAFMNGEQIKINNSNEFGVMDLNIPKGENNISLKFSETPLRLFADIISIVSFAILIIFSKVRINK